MILFMYAEADAGLLSAKTKIFSNRLKIPSSFLLTGLHKIYRSLRTYSLKRFLLLTCLQKLTER